MKTLAALLALLPLAAAAQSSAARPAPATAAAPAGAAPEVAPGVVDAATARKLVAGGIRVVDVRTAAEFAGGHLPGAINIPFDQMEQRHRELGSPSTPVLLYCRTGRRSGVASQVLQAKGFGKLYDLRSYDLWVQSEPPASPLAATPSPGNPPPAKSH